MVLHEFQGMGIDVLYRSNVAGENSSLMSCCMRSLCFRKISMSMRGRSFFPCTLFRKVSAVMVSLLIMSCRCASYTLTRMVSRYILNALTSFEFPMRLEAFVFQWAVGQSRPVENSVLTPSTVIRTKMNTSSGFDLFFSRRKAG